MDTFAIQTAVILFGSLFLYMLVFQWPVFLCMVMACATWGICFPGKLAGSTIVSSIMGSLNSTAYIAIIFYFLLGQLLNNTSLGDRLCKFLDALVGHIHGGLSHINILYSMVFAGVSGSSTADTASVGAVMIPMMKKEGYPAGYAAAITEMSSLIGPIIPPSNGFIMIAIIFECSVSKLFLGGMIPGLLMGFLQLVISFVWARKSGFPCHEWRGVKYAGKTFIEGFGAILLPVLTIVCLMFGIGTVVEIGALSVFLAVAITVVYREFHWRDLAKSLIDSAVAGGKVMAILCCAGIFTWIIAYAGLTSALSSWIAGLGLGKLGLTALCALIFFVLGFILDTSVLINIIMPLTVVAVKAAGIDLIWYSVVALVAINLGNTTPPVGQLIYLSSSIAECSSWETIKYSIPYFLSELLLIVLMLLLPGLCTWLPGIAG